MEFSGKNTRTLQKCIQGISTAIPNENLECLIKGNSNIVNILWVKLTRLQLEWTRERHMATGWKSHRKPKLINAPIYSFSETRERPVNISPTFPRAKKKRFASRILSSVSC